MRRLIERLDQAVDIETLMGYEGQTAALYFEVFPRLIRAEGIVMQGRSRRPPRDPVNAALSFGYSLLTRLMENAVLTVGLDPWVGCLHQARPGLPALVLDLIEEFRPLLVDALVLRLFNWRQLKKSDFYQPEAWKEAEAILAREDENWESVAESADPRPAIYLGESGRQQLIQTFYTKLEEQVWFPPAQTTLSFRQALEYQVRQTAQFFAGERTVWESFALR
jgi:CRISPR-associated protein Cas1